MLKNSLPRRICEFFFSKRADMSSSMKKAFHQISGEKNPSTWKIIQHVGCYISMENNKGEKKDKKCAETNYIFWPILLGNSFSEHGRAVPPLQEFLNSCWLCNAVFMQVLVTMPRDRGTGCYTLDMQFKRWTFTKIPLFAVQQKFTKEIQE